MASISHQMDSDLWTRRNQTSMLLALWRQRRTPDCIQPGNQSVFHNHVTALHAACSLQSEVINVLSPLVEKRMLEPLRRRNSYPGANKGSNSVLGLKRSASTLDLRATPQTSTPSTPGQPFTYGNSGQEVGSLNNSFERRMRKPLGRSNSYPIASDGSNSHLRLKRSASALDLRAIPQTPARITTAEHFNERDQHYPQHASAWWRSEHVPMILETAAASTAAVGSIPGLPPIVGTVAPYLTGLLWGGSSSLSEWLNWRSPPRSNMETATNALNGLAALSTIGSAVADTFSENGLPALILNKASGSAGTAGTAIGLLNAWRRTPRDWARFSPYIASGVLNFISTSYGQMSTTASREGDDVRANLYGMLSGLAWGAGALAPYVIDRLTPREPPPQSAA
jgi:hypothetical protein